MKKLSKVWLIVAGVIIIALAVYALSGSKKKEEISFETVAVAPANIMNSITATGTIEPVTSVTVGTQVSGIVSKLYVDYNSVVVKCIYFFVSRDKEWAHLPFPLQLISLLRGCNNIQVACFFSHRSKGVKTATLLREIVRKSSH